MRIACAFRDFADRHYGQIDCGSSRCRYSSAHVKPCVGCSATCSQMSVCPLQPRRFQWGADITLFPNIGWVEPALRSAKGAIPNALTVCESRRHTPNVRGFSPPLAISHQHTYISRYHHHYLYFVPTNHIIAIISVTFSRGAEEPVKLSENPRSVPLDRTMSFCVDDRRVAVPRGDNEGGYWALRSSVPANGGMGGRAQREKEPDSESDTRNTCRTGDGSRTGLGRGVRGLGCSVLRLRVCVGWVGIANEYNE